MTRGQHITGSNPGNSGTLTILDTSTWTNGPSVKIGRHQLWVYVTGQAVTVCYDVRKKGGTWRTVNGAGAGEVVAAGDDWDFNFAAIGEQQRIRIVNGATAPTLYEVTYNPVSDEMAAA